MSRNTTIIIAVVAVIIAVALLAAVLIVVMLLKNGKDTDNNGFKSVVPVIDTDKIVDILVKSRIWITVAYFIVVLCIMPLYSPNAYYTMGADKWKLWVKSSTVYILITGILYIIQMFFTLTKSSFVSQFLGNSKKSRTQSLSLLDIFFILYMFACVLSAIISPCKELVWEGSGGFKMGLWSQLCFVGVYFCISRNFKYYRMLSWTAIATAVFVFILEIIMRFGCDPLGFYNNLDDFYKKWFISTIGQASWYSSYLAVLMPLFVILYYFADKTRERIVYGILLSIGFMSTVTQNSDSAYLALAAYMFMLFWISFNGSEQMVRFFEIILILLVSFRIIGAFQHIFSEQMTRIDQLSIELSQGKSTLLGLAFFTILYFLLVMLDKKGLINISKIAFLRTVILVLIIIAMVGIVTYIALNTIGVLPANLRSTNNYLVFDDHWGNNRGNIWRFGAKSFINEDLIYKIFGSGPDTYRELVYSMYEEEIVKLWGTSMEITCAHNEWFNILITEGILGFVTYVGIFIIAFIKGIRCSKENKKLFVLPMIIVSYSAHNFFCYQQVICTSIIFIVIAIIASYSRKNYVNS